MYNPYFDLRERLGEPKWHDEHGVPRYADFTPNQTGVYDEYVALLEIACQSCGQLFLCAAVYNHRDDMHRRIYAKALGKPLPENGPDFPTALDAGSFGWGDAPWHGGDCAGATMTTEVARIVEFWQKNVLCDWTRKPEYEFAYDTIWDDAEEWKNQMRRVYASPKVGDIWLDRDPRMWSGNRRVRVTLVAFGAVTYEQVVGQNNELVGRRFRSQLARFQRAFEPVEHGLDTECPCEACNQTLCEMETRSMALAEERKGSR